METSKDFIKIAWLGVQKKGCHNMLFKNALFGMLKAYFGLYTSPEMEKTYKIALAELQVQKNICKTHKIYAKHTK